MVCLLLFATTLVEHTYRILFENTVKVKACQTLTRELRKSHLSSAFLASGYPGHCHQNWQFSLFTTF
jgi:hypothetical protein